MMFIVCMYILKLVAEMEPSDGSSTSTGGGNSESTLQLNIKTLDSQIFSFQVDKNVISHLILWELSHIM